jgi:hypothetical protein
MLGGLGPIKKISSFSPPFDSGTSVKALAEKHGRTRGAIVSRLVRLERIKDTGEVDAAAQSINPPDAAR